VSRRLGAALVGLAIATVMTAGWLAWRWWDERTSFDAERWRMNGDCRNHVRRHMVPDLTANHLRDGMTRAQVLALLGQPDYTSDERTLSYLTGPTLTDCMILDVEFAGGRLVGTDEWEN
jgi:hypothetical protein